MRLAAIKRLLDERKMHMEVIVNNKVRFELSGSHLDRITRGFQQEAVMVATVIDPRHKTQYMLIV